MTEIGNQPEFVAHADWGMNPKKRQVATAELRPSGVYMVRSLAPADPESVAKGDVRAALHVSTQRGQLLAGFDFPIGLPRTYADRVGVEFFPDMLQLLGHPPWDHFYGVARTPAEISLHRPFYPFRPGGTSRAQLTDGLGLSWQELRRRCDGTDAGTMFWTLGGQQVGKAALAGWKFLAASPQGTIRLWPFQGTLSDLMDGDGGVVVVETYPREYYKYIQPLLPPPGPWSKRRQADRLQWMPRLLAWADELGVGFERDVLHRVEEGFSSGVNGEDEFDAIVGLLGMIVVVRGLVESGEPRNDPAVTTTEGWILGRS